MLDIVTAHQHEPAAAVDRGGVDHGEAGHAPAIGVGAEAAGGESAHQPGGDADQGQNGHEDKDKREILTSNVPGQYALNRLQCRAAAESADQS